MVNLTLQRKHACILLVMLVLGFGLVFAQLLWFILLKLISAQSQSDQLASDSQNSLK